MTRTELNLDLESFRWISSQTSKQDRLALLSITESICSSLDSYTYLEVGSHLGGSLQPHVADNRCKEIFSIDPRPAEQPDERWNTNYKYENNSTQRMFDHLGLVPGADLGKIKTFESSSWDLKPDAIPQNVDFAFIDGEHTNVAVWQDFHAVRRYLAPQSVLVFHDCFVTPQAILKIRKSLGHEGEDAKFLYFPYSEVVAIVFDSQRQIVPRLLEFGWEQHLPISRRRGFGLQVKKKLPLVYKLLRKARNLPH